MTVWGRRKLQLELSCQIVKMWNNCERRMYCWWLNSVYTCQRNIILLWSARCFGPLFQLIKSHSFRCFRLMMYGHRQTKVCQLNPGHLCFLGSLPLNWTLKDRLLSRHWELWSEMCVCKFHLWHRMCLKVSFLYLDDAEWSSLFIILSRAFWGVSSQTYNPSRFCGLAARLAQSVEHETLNLRVVGSSPTLGEWLLDGSVLSWNHFPYSSGFWQSW